LHYISAVIPAKAGIQLSAWPMPEAGPLGLRRGDGTLGFPT